MSQSQRRLWTAFLIASSLAIMAPIVASIYWPAGDGLDVWHYQFGRDFINDWVGPRLAFSGRILKLFDLRAYAHLICVEYGRTIPFHNWSYPPSSLLLLAPFAFLPYFWALGLWSVAFLAVYVAVALGYVQPSRRGYALGLVLFAPATLLNLVGGQNGFITAALLLGGWAALKRRPLLAGVLFGLLTTKPHLGLVLACVLVATRSWRTILAAAATALLLVGQSVAMFGLEPWRLYLTKTSAFQTDLLVHFGGLYTPAMASVTAMLRFNGVDFGHAIAIQAATSVGVVVVTCWAVLKTSDRGLAALIIAAATPLATPYAFNYDLTALSAMLVWRLTRDAPLSPATGLVYVLAWLAPSAGLLMGLSKVGVMAAFPLLAFVAAVGEVVSARRAVKSTAEAAPLARVPEGSLCTS